MQYIQCRKCQTYMNVVKVDNEAWHMLLMGKQDITRIYTYYECNQCGLTEMYRDKEAERQYIQSPSLASQGNTT